jgi:hypothetical protein
MFSFASSLSKHGHAPLLIYPLKLESTNHLYPEYDN